MFFLPSLYLSQLSSFGIVRSVSFVCRFQLDAHDLRRPGIHRWPKRNDIFESARARLLKNGTGKKENRKAI